MGRLIGVFGGTFDPPHLGHSILAYEAQMGLGLERVLWVVTGGPPHKTDREILAAQERAEMVSMMIESEPSFEVSRAELDRQPPHFAVDTIRLLREAWPEDQLIYLMGSDSLMELPTVWHQPGKFVDEIDRLGVMARPESIVDMQWLDSELPGIQSKIDFFPAPMIEISSSLIRRRIRAGKPYRHFLTTRVGQYIERGGLYRLG